MLVQALVTEAPIERFDVRVLRRFARFDQARGHAACRRSRQHGAPAELLPLLVRSTCGNPRVSASVSSTRVTGRPPSDRAGTTVTASVVASSTIVTHFNTRPSAVRSKTKGRTRLRSAAADRPRAPSCGVDDGPAAFSIHESRDAAVVVMKPTQDWQRDDVTDEFRAPGHRLLLVDALMWAGSQ